MHLRTSIPSTLPLPHRALEPERGFMAPSGRLLKAETPYETVCIACSRAMEERSCAVALFHRRGEHFEHAGLILCPWCAEETSDRLRVRLTRTMRARLGSSLRELASATEELNKFGGFSSAIDNIGTTAQTIEHLAIACTGLILKDGETWTPTSHKAPPEWEAHVRKRLEEIGATCGHLASMEVSP